MKKCDALQEIVLYYGYINEDTLPKNPVLTQMDKSYCPCGSRVVMISERDGFEPAHFVCPKCKRVARVGGPLPGERQESGTFDSGLF